MYCIKCGHENNVHSKFCIKCGQPMLTDVPPAMHKTYVPLMRKKRLSIIISISALFLAVILVALILSVNPIAGRWYSQNGTELIMLQNGKGMTVMSGSGEAHRVHFMYAIEYQEPGYIEGEIYEKESGSTTWFYLYDGALELNDEYFYRQKPAEPVK